VAKSKSFFSTTAGLITGAAGVLSALVGAAGLAIQQGWVGGSSGDAGSSAVGRPGGAGQTGSGARSGGATAAVVPTFSVEPDSLSFQPVGSKDAKVKVRNTGVVELKLQPPTITGEDADRFKASEGTCDGPVDPGRSCELEVSFSPKTGSFTALLVVDADGGARAEEVPLKGTAAL
jgi:hypothetical protein